VPARSKMKARIDPFCHSVESAHDWVTSLAGDRSRPRSVTVSTPVTT